MFALSALLYGSSVLLHGFVSAQSTDGIPGHGLIGYGIEMYSPTCAGACQSSLSMRQLSCSTMEMDMEMHGMSMEMPETSPECFATDNAYLQTLAWCMYTYCKDVPMAKLETFWQYLAVGREKGQPEPKESYQQALAQVVQPPTVTLGEEDPLQTVSWVTYEQYIANYNAMVVFEDMETAHSRYGLVVLLSGVIIPMGLSLLRFIPWFPRLGTKINSWLIYPPAFGSRHKVPVGGLAHVPTRGQALFIAYLIAINVILCAVDIRSISPNEWFATRSSEVLTYVTNRAGVLSFANIPLLVLYAGRNNVLLKLTNWSHNTFLLVHRWVAWLATIEAVIHSAIYLQIYVAEGTHSSESKLPYWYWGAIATVGMAILLPTSILPLRQKLYELFLAWHVAISVLVVVGCYQHIFYRYSHQWGYEVWIYVAIAVWGFDRVVRWLKLARNGLRTAQVTIIDHDYVRVDIPGVGGDGHAYLYFPTLTYRVWENHPFSVASGMLVADNKTSRATDGQIVLKSDLEKSGVRVTTAASDAYTENSDEASQGSLTRPATKVGLTFFLRTHGGLTSKIRLSQTLPVLVESPYGAHEDLSEYSLVIGIAGGVGITALLPALHAYCGRAKLFWGARSAALVDEVRSSLAGIEYETFVGHRMNIRDCIEGELYGCREQVVVLVSGPASMADETRLVVSKLGREKQIAVRLVEESFSW